jgi:exopolysaccharide biosynthesis polyprenyl glycosylphosphotransferase
MNFIRTLVTNKLIPFVRKWKLVNLILGSIDILAITIAFQLSYFINYFRIGGFFFTEKNFLILYLIIMPFWLIVLYFINVTEIPRTKRYRVLFYEYLQSALAIVIMLMVIYFLFKMAWISRLFLIEFTIFGFTSLLIVRITEYKVFKTYRAQGFNYVNVVIIADDTSIPFIDKLIEKKEWGYKIVSIFSTSEKLKEKYVETIILLPEEYIAVLGDLMEADIIDEVIYMKKKVIPSEARSVIRSCEELGVTFMLHYTDEKLNLSNAVRTTIENEKFLTFINVPFNSYALAIKKIMDINFSLLGLIFLSPLFVTIAVFVKLTSRGPVIYKQERVGLRGRTFDLYKFRTMVSNADQLRNNLEAENEADGPVFKIKDDPRVTMIGGFLRKSGLDELPQLFNILKGEMSLVGPRPPLKQETLQYKRWQLRRLSVKPGLSCFWQIEPNRNEIKFDRWMELDLAYIDNWSLRLDFIILFKTVKTVFKRTGL